MGCIGIDENIDDNLTSAVAPSDTPGRPDEPEGADGSIEPDEAGGSPNGFDRWRRDSALGAVGTGIARGLHAVFAPPVDEPVIVAAVPGEPPGEDERIRVVLDPDDPTKSVAIVPERAQRAEDPEDRPDQQPPSAS
jgi:hypothetical protein